MFGPDFFVKIMARLIVVFTALPVHEFAHGFMAQKLGDDTARHQGRLTINPFAHLDPIGTILILLTGFGWAKPVQVNPYNFRNGKRDMALTALAGPVSNVLLALLVMIIYKVFGNFFAIGLMDVIGQSAVSTIMTMLIYMILTNINLAVFNFLPVPPLDGSKIFGVFIPDKYYYKMMEYQQYIAMGLMLLLVVGVLDYPLGFLSNLIFKGLDAITSFI